VDLPSYERKPGTVRFYKPTLHADKRKIEITEENAEEVRDWVFYMLATYFRKSPKLPNTVHLFEALNFSDSLCTTPLK
jgi:hypothetical protein